MILDSLKTASQEKCDTSFANKSSWNVNEREGEELWWEAGEARLRCGSDLQQLRWQMQEVGRRGWEGEDSFC